MTDHYEARCPSCGGSDEQGCYADCPKDQLTRLRSELEEAKSEQKRWEHRAQKCWDERDAEFNRRLPETLTQIEREAALRSDLEKAIEALKPFAEAYKGREGWDGSWIVGGSPIRNIHLRVAHELLSQLENSK